MFTCQCGWTIITQEGEDDALFHVKMHVEDAHAGTVMTNEEIRARLKDV